MLNNPMTAVPATGTASVIPESFSMASVNKDNVIIETIKEAEDTKDTVIRLYEAKNIRAKAELSIGFAAKSCYICDMQENELEEIPIVDGKIAYNFRGYEILTLKFKN
jgi:alpha-mannosidase